MDADHDGLLSVYRLVRSFRASEAPHRPVPAFIRVSPRSNSEFHRHPISESRVNASIWNLKLIRKAGSGPLTEELVHAVNHSLPRVGSHFHDPGIHSNRVFRACFHAETAEYTDADVDIKCLRHFLDIRIRILFCDNVDAMRRAYRLAHHARDAARRSIQACGQTVARPQPTGQRPAFLGILNRDRFTLADLKAEPARDMPREIHEKVPRGQGKPAGDFSQVDSLNAIKRLLNHTIRRSGQLEGGRGTQHPFHSLADEIAVRTLLVGKIDQYLFALRFGKLLGVLFKKFGQAAV